MRFFLFLFFAIFPSVVCLADSTKNRLTVYTYQSFTELWGPGAKIKEAFEKTCQCDLIFVSVTDGVALLNRIRLEREATKADIVLGLDANLIEEAKKTGIFVKYGQLEKLHIPIKWNDDIFIPFDYSYFAIVYNKTRQKMPPQSLRDLVEKDDPDTKIIIQDPRTSTPGLGFLLWVKYIYGDKAYDAWKKLKKKILTITPGWGESYALFVKGEAPMTLSYTTSPAWHQLQEKKNQYAAADFKEGHYVQIEVAAITKKGEKTRLSRKFIDFMLGPDFQNIIPETNWMLPAGKISVPLNPVFDTLVQPRKALFFAPEEVAKMRKDWIKEWLSAMRD